MTSTAPPLTQQLTRTARLGRALTRLGVRVTVGLASLVAMALSAEGMYRLAVTRLEVPWWVAASVCAVAELAILAEAWRAHRAILTHGHPAGHHIAVGVIAVGAGLIVAANAGSLSEVLLRVSTPILVAGLWWLGEREYATRRPDAIRWRWSTRRLLVTVGLAEPGSSSDSGSDGEQRRRAWRIVRAEARYRRTTRPWLRHWREWRLIRLREATPVSADTVAAVRRQLAAYRALTDLTGIADPKPALPAPNAPATRERQEIPPVDHTPPVRLTAASEPATVTDWASHDDETLAQQLGPERLSVAETRKKFGVGQRRAQNILQIWDSATTDPSGVTDLGDLTDRQGTGGGIEDREASGQ